jgi:hypothetical protein
LVVFKKKYANCFPSKTAAKIWFAEDLPRVAPRAALRCIQHAGDVLFVPPMWGHATLNLDESIGFAAELEWGQLVLDD